ncbi:MAG: hypothetical protein GTN76_00850 [Candidatus Aenigmarchaeota archaeon]|nr:hypothetical protein [Candidatus Aenigmarchaeota archaeon]NIQ17243.1 hypothetical protein [Candidatus Aenigmarchaeota archaeon]NIS73051.1 hypothetical protein [Candidatus Aenigmarchaeota archaeon]
MIKRRIYHAFVLVIILLGAGTFYYTYAEGWSYVDSFYFSTMTLTTIGYGDLAPTNPGSKIFTSIYALFGIGIMLYILSSVIGIFILKQEQFFGRIFLPLHKIRHHEKEIKKEKKINVEQEREIKTHEKRIKKQEKEIDRLKKEIKKKK